VVLSKVSNRLFIPIVLCAVAVYTEIHTAEHYVRSWLSRGWYRISVRSDSVRFSIQFHHRTF